jgi:hypothetical protein
MTIKRNAILAVGFAVVVSLPVACSSGPSSQVSTTSGINPSLRAGGATPQQAAEAYVRTLLAKDHSHLIDPACADMPKTSEDIVSLKFQGPPKVTSKSVQRSGQTWVVILRIESPDRKFGTTTRVIVQRSGHRYVVCP